MLSVSLAVSGTCSPPTLERRGAAYATTRPASFRACCANWCGPVAISPPLLRGPLAGHPIAAKFAAEVHRVHRRYAAEVVAANRLCPFLRDIDTGFGAFVTMLDPRGEPDVEATIEAIRAADSAII